jgi:RimJ/RimL family protein N-acetyltransferase
MPTLYTQHLMLRPFQKADYKFFVDLETHPVNLEYEADEAPSQEYLMKKFDDMLALESQENRAKYVFLVEEKGVPLGKVLIWQIDRNIDEWEMGWVLDPCHTGKGYASEASRALLEFGFRELGANRICSNCNSANTASERVMARIGMTKEGVLRETRKLRDHYYGSCIYSVLRREWK